MYLKHHRSINKEEWIYKNFIYANSGSALKQLELFCNLLFANCLSKVLADVNHVHREQSRLKLLKQGYSDFENSSPSFLYEHIEDRSNNIEWEETRENCHEPFACEVIGSHLDFTKMLEKLWHVELYELGYLKVLQVKFWNAG